MWKTFLNEISEIFFPKKCIVCSKQGEFLCDDCISLCEILQEQYCPICWPPKISFQGKTCPHHKKNLDGLISACSYENKIVAFAIKKFKYEPGIKELSPVFAQMIVLHLNAISKNPQDFRDFLAIPIPISKQKLKVREFNQSAQLAHDLSKVLPITYCDALQRLKNTPPQSDLNRTQRELNVQNAFQIKNGFQDLIKDKNILLIDDIFTTGATCQECAKILKTAGAKSIWAMTIAREGLK